jgi:hypothetical protein
MKLPSNLESEFENSKVDGRNCILFDDGEISSLIQFPIEYLGMTIILFTLGG